jgi:hypothetical protein
MAFKPPADIGLDKRTFWKVEQLQPNSLEYRYAAFKFLKTYGARVPALNSI